MAIDTLDAPLTAEYFSYDPFDYAQPADMPVELPRPLANVVGYTWLRRSVLERIIEAGLDAAHGYGTQLAHDLIAVLDALDAPMEV